MTTTHYRISRPWLKASSWDADWSGFLQTSRNARIMARHFRLLGLGYNISWNRSIRQYTVSVGHMPLLNIAGGYVPGPPPEADAYTHKLSSYVQLNLLGFGFSWGADTRRVRVFFNDRRLTWPKVVDGRISFLYKTPEDATKRSL
ncbi:hypothetical protein KIKIMORA_02050 [Brevundimonas phage vB_BpoS-Kikimora]|uniref:Uncharacterized protein n=1 Tax=Brevundimonas phage vB_BpoS-Kikimora TaxID=2948601 RepID=A0A9E7MTH1_9CAUD|nr:hypothetical protein KIKIMORA_02050 [Brevundimonas phage vB_BpoS-Kikimora]